MKFICWLTGKHKFLTWSTRWEAYGVCIRCGHTEYHSAFD